MTQLSSADKFGMYVGGGLVILGVVVIGLLEMLLGAGHPVTGEGQIVHEALVPLAIRSYIIMAGLAAWGLTALYKLVPGDGVEQTQESQQLAD
ncbi:MAG: hypothetical protein U5J98_10915 [Halobacteriales archaeon]|nr:hypothetical protein [Halobacteriales archaeon]